MSVLREAKEKLVQEITEKILNSKSTYLVEYLGLSVADITKLRNDLRTEGSELKVYKNRFVKIAVKNAGIKGLDYALLGPNAFVFSNQDEISGARIVAEHAKQYNFLKFKAGIFEGKVIDAKFATTLSQIPSRETLLIQIATGLMQPLQQVAIGLDMLEESHIARTEKIPIEIKKETKVKETSVQEEVKEKSVLIEEIEVEKTQEEPIFTKETKEVLVKKGIIK